MSAYCFEHILAARSKSDNHATNDALKELKRDLERRIQDIQAGMEQGETGFADESLAALRKEFERRLSDVRVQIDESVEPGREAIRERPLVAVGAALAGGLAAGVLLGVLLGRKSKE
jgi:ElaB/YqjD/DUF883 family membrane-anchored ribosome-binding protein